MRENYLFSHLRKMLTYLKMKKDRQRIKYLVGRGCKVGRNVYIGEQVIIDSGYPYLIEVGDNCRISSGAVLLAHDATMFRELGVTRIKQVKILEGSFIGTRAIILPGVTIGPNAIIAAGAVVNRDIGEGMIAAGNPARPYGKFVDLLNSYVEQVHASQVFMKKDIEDGVISFDTVKASVEKDSIAFVSGVPSSDPYYIHTDMDEIRKAASDAFSHYMRSKKIIEDVDHE